MSLEEVERTEESIDHHLASAWNEFCKLVPSHPAHGQSFAVGIHQCQQVIMWRELQRILPNKYPTYASMNYEHDDL